MTKYWSTAVFLVSLLAFAAPPVKSGDPWMYKDPYAKLYKAGSPTTIKGNVLSTEDFSPYEGMEPGMKLKLGTPDGEISVHVGPHWLIDQHNLNFTQGTPMVITGIQITFDKKPAIIADVLEQGGKTVTVRHPNIK